MDLKFEDVEMPFAAQLQELDPKPMDGRPDGPVLTGRVTLLLEGAIAP